MGEVNWGKVAQKCLVGTGERFTFGEHIFLAVLSAYEEDETLGAVNIEGVATTLIYSTNEDFILTKGDIVTRNKDGQRYVLRMKPHDTETGEFRVKVRKVT